MKHQFSTKERKELELKMATVFSEKLQMLPTEMQQILLDDLVTAFENRLKVLKGTQVTLEFEVPESVECETF